ncbi:MAG: aminotransferase class IV, partial [Gammaproteobacteria bacterium]
MSTLLNDTMADRDGVIWFNGQLIKWRDANIHILTHGLHYASVAFEGERAYGGKVFRLKEHSQRLLDSAKMLRIPIDYSLEDIMAATDEVIKANQLPDCYVRPVVYRGPEVMGLLPSSAAAHVAIAAWEWPSYFDMATKMKGIKLQWAEWRRPAPNTAPV